MAILLYPRWPLAAILNFWKPKFSPLDLLSPKTHPRTKHHVDQQTGCEVMAILYPRWPLAAVLDFW